MEPMTDRKRIIPCLDVDKGRVVKGKKFKNIQDVADPLELARKYSEAGADELVFYDITASTENRQIFLDLIGEIAQEVDIPFTVGGGIKIGRASCRERGWVRGGGRWL